MAKQSTARRVLPWGALLLTILLAAIVHITRVDSQPQRGDWNGFDLRGSLIPQSEIHHGGPLRDGIPSIDNPTFTTPANGKYMLPDDVVISVTHRGVTRAYPLRIIVWHEIVNDQIEDLYFAVTYCPLCGTAMVFNREIDSQLRTFAVSGLLYQSDVRMYDRETESLWSQLAMKSVAGKAAGLRLELLASEHLTWSAWTMKYPQGEVLSTQTGFTRNYQQMPYQGYEENPQTFFPVPMQRKELPTKAWIVGIIVNGQAKAYPIEFLAGVRHFEDQVADRKLEIHYDPSSRRPSVTDLSNEQVIPYTIAYWFAWQAFYPKTQLWRP